MKIPLGIQNEQLEVEAVVRAPKYRIGISLIDFIVDTGSQRSFIGYGDALRLHLPLRALRLCEPMRFGGTGFGLYEIEKVAISFLNEQQKPERFFLEQFYVAKPTRKGQEKFLAQQLPSILGLDFMIKNKLALYLNPSKHLTFLEKED